MPTPLRLLLCLILVQACGRDDQPPREDPRPTDSVERVVRTARGLPRDGTSAPRRRSRRAVEALSTPEKRPEHWSPHGSPIFIRIFKESRELEVWAKRGPRFQRWKTYPICAMSGELGPKVRQGDMQAPEGFYAVSRRSLNPHSRFHLSFNVGYPNTYDRSFGRTGSYIMVHGDCVSAGCFAMGDGAVEEIYRLTEAAFDGGQRFFRVHIFPFRMTSEALRQRRGSRWFRFWTNLKTGYDLFEHRRVPPNVEVRDRRYVFDGDEAA